MSSNESNENQANDLEHGECVIAQPVYSNENLIGFTISPSKIKDFLDQVANYQSSGEPDVKIHQPECDKSMKEIVTAVSRYCWENEKCLSPTNKSGFLIFEDLKVNNCIGKKWNQNYINAGSQSHTQKSRLKSVFEKRQFPKNTTFESLSELIRYRRIHRIPSDLCDGEEQSFRLSKRAKTDLDPEYRQNNGNGSHNFIFNPKILTFLDNSKSNSPSRFHQLVNKKKTPFPPSIREDFVNLKMHTGNFPWSTGGYAVGNLPYTGAGLYNSSKQSPNMNLIEGPLNYDEYLKRFAEQKNKMQDFLLWDRLCKAENEKTSEQSSLHCSSSQNLLNEFSHVGHLETELDNQSFNSFASTKNYYELNVTTESIKGNLIHQSLDRFQSPTTVDLSQSQYKRKKLSNFKPSENKNRDIDGNDQNQRKKLVSKKKLSFTYDSSTEEDEYRSTEISTNTNPTAGKSNVPDKSSRLSHSTFLPMTRKFVGSNVTLTKKFYYCTPPINALDLLVCSHSGKCLVNEFRVGHEHFGHVTFHGEIDVAGLNLDEIVDFRLKQLTLYPNDEEEKNILPGMGLKRLATVTLFKVWPMDKSKRHFITDPGELKRMNYENMLRKSCQRTNSTFISYKPEFGHWSFKISQWNKEQ